MNTQKQMSTQAWAELLLLSLIWGGIFLSVRIALDEIGPLTAVANRVAWAALLLWVVVLVGRVQIPQSPKVWIGFVGMGLLNNVIPFSLQAWGQLYIESGLTSILNAGTAVFGVLVAAIFLADERLTRRKAIGVAFGFAGVITAIGFGALASFDLRSMGQLAVIASTISYAFAGVWARKMLAGVPPVMAACGMLTASSVIALPLAWTVEGPLTLALSPTTWAAIAFYAVVATAGAYLLFYRVLDMAGAANLMLCTLLIAPVAIVLGTVVLGEELPLRAYGGFALIGMGLIILDGRLIKRFL
ncbi:DMT family transporter [Thalassobium sp. R2A62]|jgi:drug/metabolite transporter (DMT)-like permease|uniref:DMT family transporter n=1 Tax=Thalassobium sp. R2A62 TaxID=633131 RepID=UPI0001B1D707|nr:DMT family transporter [Thalassobium sp. R2A62]EET49314.1 transmembrane drug/metabolite transporter family protein [Thalassobium sp. R2A62]MDG1339443.1 DMT family transporter [Paracoccaceae bacterium]MDG2452469.1 DMT family transporter [Paracoccaceae bacterium]